MKLRRSFGKMSEPRRERLTGEVIEHELLNPCALGTRYSSLTDKEENSSQATSGCCIHPPQPSLSEEKQLEVTTSRDICAREGADNPFDIIGGEVGDLTHDGTL